VIPESLYPDLSTEAESRTIANIMMLEFAGALRPSSDLTLYQMVKTLVRLVDGSFVDYQAARQAYFDWHQDQRLGNDRPLSAALLLVFHHIENCITNLKRVREMAIAIRKRYTNAGVPSPFPKVDWQLAESNQDAIRRLRDAIQHHHDDLKKGVHNDAAVQYVDTGGIKFGTCTLTLPDLASTLRAYRVLAAQGVAALRGTDDRGGA
jgi:hypothetical protein